MKHLRPSRHDRLLRSNLFSVSGRRLWRTQKQPCPDRRYLSRPGHGVEIFRDEIYLRRRVPRTINVPPRMSRPAERTR